MWHASAGIMGRKLRSREFLRTAALKALEGVGDAGLGQWEDYTGRVFHLRRRLSLSEELITGPPVDVRGTEEAERRVAMVRKQCPHVPESWIETERKSHEGCKV